MKAIQTRYLGHTNTRPARIKVWAHGVPPLVIPRDSLGDDPHRDAAVALCRRYNWTTCLTSGGLANGDEVFTFAVEEARLRRALERIAKANTTGDGPSSLARTLQSIAGDALVGKEG